MHLLKWDQFSSPRYVSTCWKISLFPHFPFLDGIATPTGVFLDSSLNIYVAEYGNYRVTKWTSGNTTAGAVVAGGNGLSNNLNSLQTSGIYVGLLGEIYVPDLSKLICIPQKSQKEGIKCKGRKQQLSILYCIQLWHAAIRLKSTVSPFQLFSDWFQSDLLLDLHPFLVKFDRIKVSDYETSNSIFLEIRTPKWRAFPSFHLNLPLWTTHIIYYRLSFS